MNVRLFSRFSALLMIVTAMTPVARAIELLPWQKTFVCPLAVSNAAAFSGAVKTFEDQAFETARTVRFMGLVKNQLRPTAAPTTKDLLAGGEVGSMNDETKTRIASRIAGIQAQFPERPQPGDSQFRVAKTLEGLEGLQGIDQYFLDLANAIQEETSTSRIRWNGPIRTLLGDQVANLVGGTMIGAAGIILHKVIAAGNPGTGAVGFGLSTLLAAASSRFDFAPLGATDRKFGSFLETLADWTTHPTTEKRVLVLSQTYKVRASKIQGALNRQRRPLQTPPIRLLPESAEGSILYVSVSYVLESNGVNPQDYSLYVAVSSGTLPPRAPDDSPPSPPPGSGIRRELVPVYVRSRS